MRKINTCPKCGAEVDRIEVGGVFDGAVFRCPVHGDFDRPTVAERPDWWDHPEWAGVLPLTIPVPWRQGGGEDKAVIEAVCGILQVSDAWGNYQGELAPNRPPADREDLVSRAIAVWRGGRD